MSETVRVQVLFTVDDPATRVQFTDALYFGLDEYAALKPDAIEALKQERFNAWKQAVAAKPAPVKEPVDVRIAAVDEQLAKLTAEKAALVAEKDAAAVTPPKK